MDDDIIPIAIMGPTGTGKSTFINLASGSHLNVGDDLQSCTIGVEVSPIFKFNGRRVVLIDTPGFDDTTRSDTDILKHIALYMSETYQAEQKLKGIIYMHRISDVRVGGIARRNFNMFRKLCGDQSLGNVVIVTNMWEAVPPETGLAREQQLASEDKFFKPALEGGARMMRHESNTRDSAHRILEYFLDKPRQTLCIQRELVDERKVITATAAAVELDRHLAETQSKQKEELREVQKELEDALRMNDVEMRKELEVFLKDLEKKVAAIDNDRQRLLPEYMQASEELRERLQAEEAQHEQHQIQLRNLQAQAELAARVSRAERQMLEQRIRELQSKGHRRDRSMGLGGLLFGSIGAACAGVVPIPAGRT